MKAIASGLSLLCFSLITACSDNSGTGVVFGGGGNRDDDGSSGNPFGSGFGSGGETTEPGGGAGAAKGKGGSASGQAGTSQAGGGSAGKSSGSAGKNSGSAGKNGGSAGTSSGSAQGPRAMCDGYIACIAAASPAVLAPIVDAYGKEGNCFDQGDDALCEKACKKGMIQAHKSYSKVAECNYCDTSQDCGASQPACDPVEHLCKACDDGTHCKDKALPVCDLGSFKCVACNENADCNPDSKLPVCNVATHSCEACQSDADCVDPYGEGKTICGTSGQCRGCLNDGECGGSICNTSSHRCVECQEDADCSGGGMCSPFGQGCCGVGACAAAGYACGYAKTECNTLLLGPLTVSCGECNTGELCREHACVPHPPEGCNATCGPDERCGYDGDSNTRHCLPRTAVCQKGATNCGTGFYCSIGDVPNKPDVFTYTCVADCLLDTDCPLSAAGKAGKCIGVDDTSGVCHY